MIKLLLGGSPCTHWSIAQKNGRETKPEGLGWELFKNYLIAKGKFKPDYFLYENNKSASQAIKNQISDELDTKIMHINSALVSAQTRERFYAFNWTVEQPRDRGIIVRDILEPSVDEINYELKTVGVGWRGRKGEDGKYHKRYESTNEEKANALTTVRTDSMVAEPIYVGELPIHNGTYRNGKQPSQQYRIYSADSKAVAVTTCAITNVAEPIRIGDIGSIAQAHRVYSCDGKSVTINAGGGGQGGKTGLYACPAIGNEKIVYEVRNGFITIEGVQYPIKLADGYYIIRKFTPTECERLQTLPDGYTAGVSNAQRYKALGNGWTAEVIIHILNGVLSNVPRDEEIVVLAMYDGIGTGRYCLDKMGFINVKYFAYEIDKYAKQIAKKNYSDIIHCGNAFDLRHPDWTIGY
jgi:DNA (cytosine-5)-methyltransferase 3A